MASAEAWVLGRRRVEDQGLPAAREADIAEDLAASLRRARMRAERPRHRLRRAAAPAMKPREPPIRMAECGEGRAQPLQRIIVPVVHAKLRVADHLREPCQQLGQPQHVFGRAPRNLAVLIDQFGGEMPDLADRGLRLPSGFEREAAEEQPRHRLETVDPGRGASPQPVEEARLSAQRTKEGVGLLLLRAAEDPRRMRDPARLAPRDQLRGPAGTRPLPIGGDPGVDPYGEPRARLQIVEGSGVIDPAMPVKRPRPRRAGRRHPPGCRAGGKLDQMPVEEKQPFREPPGGGRIALGRRWRLPDERAGLRPPTMRGGLRKPLAAPTLGRRHP